MYLIYLSKKYLQHFFPKNKCPEHLVLCTKNTVSIKKYLKYAIFTFWSVVKIITKSGDYSVPELIFFIIIIIKILCTYNVKLNNI